MKKFKSVILLLSAASLIITIYLFNQRFIYDRLYTAPLLFSFLFLYSFYILNFNKYRFSNKFIVFFLLISSFAETYGRLTIPPLHVSKELSAIIDKTDVADMDQKLIDHTYAVALGEVSFYGDGVRSITFPANFKSEILNTNAHGFRSRYDIFKPKEIDDEFRVIILGGSAPFGWQAPSDEDVISEIIEKKLNEEGQAKVKVYNLSVPTGHSSIDANIMGSYVTQMQPDLLLILGGPSDLKGAISRQKNISNAATAWIHGRSAFSYNVKMLINSASVLVKKAISIFYVTSFIDIKSQVSDDRFKSIQKNIDEYTKNLKVIYSIAEFMNIQAYTFHLPTQISTQYYNYLSKVLPVTDTKAFEAFKKAAPLNFAHRIEKQEVNIREIIGQLGRYGSTYIDLTKMFTNWDKKVYVEGFYDEGLFVSDSHWSKIGTDLVAQEIIQHIKPLIE